MTSRSVLIALAMWMLALQASAGQTEALDIDAYRGKVVVVDFWASWCVPCRRSFPWLNAMQERHGDAGLVIIGVNVDREKENATEFLERYPATFQIVYDPEATLAEQFGVRGMPTSFVIGRNGDIVANHEGFKVKRQDEYEAVIIAALAEEVN